MLRGVFIASTGLVAAMIAATIHLASAPDPLALEPALVLATGLILYTLIALAGLMLSRGRWSRVLAFALVAGYMAVVVVTEASPWSIAAAVAAAVTLAVLVGPWMRGWLRLRPAADGPGPIPITLALGLVGLVPLVAITNPADLSAWHGVVGAAGCLLAYAYSRAQVWSVWAVRLALPVLAVPAVAASPPAGAAVLAFGVVALAALGWTRAALLAADPVHNRLPGPRVRTPRSATLGDDGQ